MRLPLIKERGENLVGDRRARLRIVMPVLVVFALLLCAQSAFAQTRPQLSEVFESLVTVQVTGAGGEVSEGVGEVAFNQPAGQARERYLFHGDPPTEILTRYDLGKIFSIDPPSCDITEVAGPMPLTWGWIAGAKQDGAVVINGIPYTEWVFRDVDGSQKTVAATSDGTIPAYYQVSTPEKTVRLTFLNWQTTFNQKKDALKPPNHCPK